MKEIEITKIVANVNAGIRREQDLALLERDQQGRFVQHSINVIALSGALDFLSALHQRGVKLLVPEDALAELGVNVDS